jgi:hypothetical protein
VNITLEDGTIVTGFEDIKKATKNPLCRFIYAKEEAYQSNIISMLEHIPLIVSNDENLTSINPFLKQKFLHFHMDSRARQGSMTA